MGSSAAPGRPSVVLRSSRPGRFTLSVLPLASLSVVSAIVYRRSSFRVRHGHVPPTAQPFKVPSRLSAVARPPRFQGRMHRTCRAPRPHPICAASKQVKSATSGARARFNRRARPARRRPPPAQAATRRWPTARANLLETRHRLAGALGQAISNSRHLAANRSST